MSVPVPPTSAHANILTNIFRKAGRYMRKTVLWQSPHVRASLSALLALVAIAVLIGCGGGGGGGNNGGNNNGKTIRSNKNYLPVDKLIVKAN